MVVTAAAPSIALRALFAVPLIGAAVGLFTMLAVGPAIGGAFLAGLGTALWRGAVLRYVALLVALVVWVNSAAWVCYAFGFANAGLFAEVFLVLFVVFIVSCAVRLGGHWGRERYDRLRAVGRGIQEWQWVYVGPEVARGLMPYARPGWPIHLTSGLILAQCVSAISSVVLLGGPVWFNALLLGGAGFGFLTVWALWCRSPAAYPMVMAALVFALPFSIPLIVYWAEGRRPNLIYRHRFERLVPEGGGAHV